MLTASATIYIADFMSVKVGGVVMTLVRFTAEMNMMLFACLAYVVDGYAGCSLLTKIFHRI